MSHRKKAAKSKATNKSDVNNTESFDQVASEILKRLPPRERYNPLQDAYDRCAGLYGEATFRIAHLGDGKGIAIDGMYAATKAVGWDGTTEMRKLIGRKVGESTDEAYQEANKMTEDELGELYRKGCDLLSTYKIEEGIKVLQICAKAGYQQAYGEIGAIALAYDKDNDVAESWFEGVVDITFLSFRAAYAYGMLLYFERKDAEKALRYFDYACEHDFLPACSMASFVFGRLKGQISVADKWFPRNASREDWFTAGMVPGNHNLLWFGDPDESCIYYLK